MKKRDSRVILKFILPLFIIWRLSLFFIAFLGSKIIPFNPTFPYADGLLIPSKLPFWFWSFANFDGVHYLTIAKSGYSAQYTQAFFPLYPLLIRGISFIFQDKFMIISGLLLSNFLFLTSLILFYKLIRLDYSQKTAKWSLLFLTFFPTSFFFGSLYSESLFLFLVLSTFYGFRQRKWLLAIFPAIFASATRLVGIFLMMPLGLMAYMLYLQIKFHDALYFLHAQPVFNIGRTSGQIIILPQVLWRYLKILTTTALSYQYALALLELSALIFTATLLLIGHQKKINPFYLIFSWLSLITPTLTGSLSSLPRYILPIFPVFIVMAMTKSKILKILLLAVCCLLFAVFTIFFTAGRFIA